MWGTPGCQHLSGPRPRGGKGGDKSSSQSDFKGGLCITLSIYTLFGPAKDRGGFQEASIDGAESGRCLSWAIFKDRPCSFKTKQGKREDGPAQPEAELDEDCKFPEEEQAEFTEQEDELAEHDDEFREDREDELAEPEDELREEPDDEFREDREDELAEPHSEDQGLSYQSYLEFNYNSLRTTSDFQYTSLLINRSYFPSKERLLFVRHL